jgi:aminopeptidase
LNALEKEEPLTSEFETNLAKLSEVIVEVALNLQPRQRLLMVGPLLEHAPLVRQISEKAYKLGARFVDVMWSDELLSLIRFKNAPRDSFKELSSWWINGIHDVAKAGDAIIRFNSVDPDLLIDQDPSAIATAQQTLAVQSKPFQELVSRNALNWVLIAPPSGAWSEKLFPDIDLEDRTTKFWDVMFEICRIKEENPVSAWKNHLQQLKARCEYLNQKQYSALKFTSSGTELTVGLPRGHLWKGGQSTTQSGIDFVPNFPTEEIFTLPHRNEVDGFVTATKPVSAGGFLIEDISFTLSEGRITRATASRHEEIMLKLIQMDEGATRLGEIALVPHSSSISQLDTMFYNILLDENTSIHLAVGNAYKFCMTDGESMSDDEFLDIGGNISNLHGDVMIGSGEMDVDGVTANSIPEPVMRAGEWAFDV